MTLTALPKSTKLPEATMRHAVAMRDESFDGAAEAASLRPCKRCDPRSVHGAAQLMQGLAQYIDENADEPVPLSRLAKQAHLSPAHLQRKFKAVLGVCSAPGSAARSMRYRLSDPCMEISVAGSRRRRHQLWRAGCRHRCTLCGLRLLPVRPIASRCGCLAIACFAATGGSAAIAGASSATAP